jgi:thiamine biosynthesis lipoprotein
MASSPNYVPVTPDARGVRTVSFRALGTACVIQFRCEDEKKSLLFLADALGWLGDFEAKFSRFRADSLVSKINQAAGHEWVTIDQEMATMLDLADDMFHLTKGILDPSMLPLLQVWDWKKVHTELPATTAINEALRLTGWGKVQRRANAIFLPHAGMGLDFGGFGKEYAVDQLVKIAVRHSIVDALIDLGRDIFGIGGNGIHPFWHVGIQDGIQHDKCIGGLAVSGFAVCASGDYARRFEHHGVTYGHIIDPRTGWPVRNGLHAVTVTAPTCLMAGIYATCIFVLGKKEGLHYANCAPQLDACVQDEQSVEKTKNFIRKQVQAA